MKGAEAIPEALVVAVIALVLLLNVPEAPVPAGVNVTITPDTALPVASFTVTPNAVVKAARTMAD